MIHSLELFGYPGTIWVFKTPKGMKGRVQLLGRLAWSDAPKANRSVRAVMEGMNPDCALSLPSPVMLNKLKEMVDLNELERLLCSDMPHLFNIAHSAVSAGGQPPML